MKSFYLNTITDPECKEKSKRSYIVTLLLCFFFGWAGFHRFYTGKIISGLLMLFTLGLFGIWVLFDFLIIVFGAFRDAEGRKITY